MESLSFKLRRFFGTITAVVILVGLSFPSDAQQAPKFLPFQGRLTDQNGDAVSNGVRLVQFKIFEVSSGGSSVWAGELHRTTVNGGLVNVLLGSKTPFTGVDFDRQLYLEITVDINGDNAITAADPPMLPRQAILPVVFAKEAADSRRLADATWSDILVSGNDPRTGHIRASKLEPAGITSAQVAPGAIDTGQIASNAVRTANILDGQITTAKLSPELMLDSVIPPGMIQAFGGANIPPGWLLCDGRAVSSGQYARLYSALSTNWGIGILGSTNDFNLPDLRAVFLRGVNGARSDSFADPDAASRLSSAGGANSGNKVGSFQADAFAQHLHNLQGLVIRQGTEINPLASFGFIVNLDQPPFIPTTATGGSSETRPKNAYVNYIIKY